MPDTTPKRKRQKATTELGRQMLQKERQRLAKEQAALGERLANEAAAARNAKFNRPTTRAPKQQVIVNRSIVRRVAGVLASENVVVPIRAEAAAKDEQMKAWTDFEQISVRFKQHDDVRLLSATLRGLLYHEGGHCRWTVPFVDLMEMVREALGTVPLAAGVTNHRQMHKAWNCLEDQRMETAVVSDAPRKASFFTPMLMTEHMKTLDYMAANYPLFVWRRYLPARLVNEARRLFIVRHGAEGDRLVRDLDRVTTSYVMATDAVTMWQAVIEYHGLLQDMKPLAVNMDDAGHTQQRSKRIRTVDADDEFDGLTIPISPDMLPPTTDEDWGMDEDEDDSDVTPPMDLDDFTEDEVQHIMEILAASMLSPETLITVRYMLPPDPQDEQSEEGDDGEQGEGTPGDLADEEEDDSDGQESADGEAEEPGEDDAQGEQDVAGRAPAPLDDEADDGEAGDDDERAEADDEAGEEDDGDHDEEGGATGSHTDDGADLDDPMTQDELDEIIEEAEQERYNSSELDGDVDAFRNAAEDLSSALDSYVGGISSNERAVADAEVLAQQIEDSLHAHTMEHAPSWVEEQRRGVLNVGRYATRQPGDTEFFRQWTEDDAPGFDMAVSILLDYSMSMEDHAERLAQMAYASKLACQKLDIPCTVVLWDTDARTLWDAMEPAEHMPTISCTGGTNPSIALTDLDNQRMDRSKHLVLIMTDGQWQGDWAYGKRTLAWYKDAGRKLIGFGYGNSNLAAGLIGKGCDEAFGITDLMDIPARLEEALVDMID